MKKKQKKAMEIKAISNPYPLLRRRSTPKPSSHDSRESEVEKQVVEKEKSNSRTTIGIGTQASIDMQTKGTLEKKGVQAGWNLRGGT